MSQFKEVPTEQLLSFQEFTPVHEPSFSNAQLSINISKSNDFPDYNINDNHNLENDLNPQPKDAALPFWSLEFYQKLFDVDTSEVIERILGSFIPRGFLLKDKVKSKPDLYGPLWISLTLVFAIAVNGNIAAYLVSANKTHEFKYNFHLVSGAATAIYLYIGMIPIILWAFIKWTKNESEADDMELEESSSNILQLICIYGYSIFIYVPISILWVIQVKWFQWTLVIVGALLSGFVLIHTLMPSIKRSKHRLPLLIGIIACHLLLAAGFKLYFFHFP